MTQLQKRFAVSERYRKEVPNGEITCSEWLVERVIELEERLTRTLDAKLEKLDRAFRGLWRSVTITGGEREEGFACTIHLNGEMVETLYFKSPGDALDEAIIIREKLVGIEHLSENMKNLLGRLMHIAIVCGEKNIFNAHLFMEKTREALDESSLPGKGVK